MPKYEGLVERVTNDEEAEVLIKPGAQGIVGAPEVSKKVCHSASDGSFVRTETLNKAGAQVGDWVAVTHKPGVLLKNCLTLLGIPVAGGIVGLVVGMASGGGMAMFGAAGVVLGIVGGVAIYRSSGKNIPMITRVIKSREELASFVKEEPVVEDNGCALCTQCIK